LFDFIGISFYRGDTGMDAAKQLRNEEKTRLLDRLSQIMVEEQREQGTFDRTPHFSTLEQAAHALGQQLSRSSQRRASAEVAASGSLTADCPTCKKSCAVETSQRTVTSLDGPIELSEPKARCPACRRDFFPSA
jgi:hypothetical protein